MSLYNHNACIWTLKLVCPHCAWPGLGQLWSRPNIESVKRIYYCSNPRSETFFIVMSSSKAIPLRCQSGDPSLFPHCHFHKVASYQGLFACALLSLKRSTIETTGIHPSAIVSLYHKSTQFSQITIYHWSTFFWIN